MFLLFFYLWAYCVRYVYRWVLSFFKADNLSRKSVLITGCDSGFGQATALRLDARGMKVFAGCLTQDGVDYLRKNGSVRLDAILMNVANQSSVDNACQHISAASPDGLWGVINNAGLMRTAAVDFDQMGDWQLQFDVNVKGIVRTTMGVLPLLRKAKGRIVNIASVAGRVAFPGTASYSASKYAVEGLSDAWRRELAVFDVKVVIVEPGIMKTNLWDVPLHPDQIANMFNRGSAEAQELYGMKYLEDAHKAGMAMVEKWGGDPVQVVDALEQTVVSRWPLYRYTVGSDTWIFMALAQMPEWMSDFTIANLNKKKPVPIGLKAKRD